MDPRFPLIAIVDDEESVRKALERLLRSAGMDAHVFPSGAEFLAAMADLSPDCVVLDLHMPGVSGFDVLDALPTRCPVVVITGHHTEKSETRAIESGAFIYLPKPVNDRDLIAAIHAAIAHSAMGRADISK